jgi:radical SAM protein with 4Fe4S-binding SPASM domain
MSDQDISAVIQPRIYSAPKAPLEDRVPLSTPLSAHIDVCSLCNFKCSFCFQADNQAMKEANLQRGFMPVDLFKKIVDDLAEFDEKLKKIKIGNHGEPTMHPDLPEMVAYARQKDVAEVIELFTNASKLNPQLNQAIINAGMQRINISLEGLTSERYMQVAGVRQDMQQLIDAIAHLHSISKDCQIYVKIADQTSSLDKTDHTIHVMNDEERQYFLDTFGNICDEIYIEKIVPQWAETQAEKQNDVNETGMYHQKIKKYKEVCPFTFMYLHFNCDGTTSPCTLDWPRKVVIGNVKEQSAKEIWEGESLHNLRVAMLRDARNRINFCKNCSAPMVCVDEDFDPYKEKVLKAINADNDISLKNNEWVSDNDK